MNRRDILADIDPDNYRGLDVDLQGGLPAEVEDCVQSVKDDNPGMDKSTAIAICRDQLDMTDNGGCPSGQININGNCVTIEQVDTVPSLLSSPTEFTLSEVATEPIERVQEDETTVRYRHVKLLQSGVWTDANSRETIWYSPEGIKNLEIADDNALNVMHDDDNEVATAGHIDPESVEATDNALYADLVIDTSKPVGEFADQNLQQTLETQGAKGFGGPSVEISADGQRVEFNDRKGMHEMKAGVISGAGLVGNPASKPVAFSRQTAERGVALSDGEGGATVMELTTEHGGMSDMEFRGKVLSHVDESFTLQGPLDEVRDDAQNIADELDVPVDEVMEVLDPLLDMPEGGEEEGGEMAGRENETHDDMDGEEDGDEDEEKGMDMAEVENRVESLEERLTNVEDMVEQAMAAEDMEETLSEELAAAREELADADTVAELQDAREELDRRLSELEERPEAPKSLSDGDDGDGVGGGDNVEGPISAVPSRDRPY